MMNCPNCNYEDGNDEKPFVNITLDGPLTIANFYACPSCGVFFFNKGYVPDKPNIDVKKMTQSSKPWANVEPRSFGDGGWDYRIIKDGDLYTIHEVYYDDNGDPELVTIEPDFPAGETLDELRKDFEHYRDAWEKPVLPIEMFLRKDS